ncbi:MAG: GNVR domain-containing protein [Patescibacteria group bacterium]
MELFEFANLLNKRKQTILIIALFVLLLTAIFTLVQPFKYGSNLKVLVIQNFSANTDPYTASKSNEYLSNILDKVIYSNSFYVNVLASGFNIDKNYFSGNAKEQMKKWTKTIDSKVINDSGIITVNVYHSNRSQAEQIARAIGYTLQTKHALYHGGGNNVNVKIIDEPITSDFPVKPNVILNLVLGISAGLFFALTYVYLFPEERFNILRFFEKNKKAQIFESEFLSAKNDFQESKVKDNWQFVGKILNKRFVAPANVLVKEEANDSVVAFKDKTVKDDLLSSADNNLVKQPIIEEFINKGNMNNIFGKSYSDKL